MTASIKKVSGIYFLAISIPAELAALFGIYGFWDFFNMAKSHGIKGPEYDVPNLIALGLLLVSPLLGLFFSLVCFFSKESCCMSLRVKIRGITNLAGAEVVPGDKHIGLIRWDKYAIRRDVRMPAKC
jgi:hypothetical protein